MQKVNHTIPEVTGKNFTFLLVSLLCAFFFSNAQAFTVNVVDQNGVTLPVTASGFKWLLEEDNTHPPLPGVHQIPNADVNNNTLSLSIHRSHAPVVAEGASTANSAVIETLSDGVTPLPPGRYFVSVLPFGNRTTCTGTYDMGGSPVTVVDNSEVVTVYVRQQPTPTAQMSVKVFHDVVPLNNFPDPTEAGLPGFTVTIGDQGGDIVTDAWGNKLGTTYVEPIADPCNPVVDTIGSGDFVTDANGEVIIKNIVPNKYAVQVEPPSGETGWLQTTTIEGTHTIDAWVRPNEPQFSTIVQPGVPLWHIYTGYVQERNNPAPGGIGGTTITGQVRKAHLSRPPDLFIFPGPPPEGEAVGERCIVGLHDLSLAVSETFFISKCEDGTGNFEIPGVPAGTYQLVVWDISLLHIISFETVIADGVNPVNMGPVSTPMWFGIQEHNVFTGDPDAPGFGIPEQNVNLRFRDGTIYGAFPTDTSGFVPFQAVFPWFHWLVAEVDFATRKATGLTVTNDLGGEIPDLVNADGKRNPQTFVEYGPVLTEAFQLFAGQNQKFEWFKDNYGTDENGGISGTVTYATTRAEDDPRYAAVEPWEPGVPRVQVALYGDIWCNSDPTRTTPAIPGICPEANDGIGDGLPDDRLTSSGTGFITPGVVSYADVDNYPLNWAPENCASGGQTCSPGPEDVDQNGNGNFNLNDALSVTWTDSWDDNLPANCDPGTATAIEVHGEVVPIEQCAEGLRTFNQTVPGVFDGGFAFGPDVSCSDIAGSNTVCNDVTTIGADGLRYLKKGTYIVQTATPPGYQLLKEEDRNVDFGLTSIPAIPPPACVGEDRLVPNYFSFLTENSDGYDPLLPGVVADVDSAAPFAGDLRPLCDMKKVDLGSGQNAAAEFHLFTNVPKAARAVGLLGDDLANELAVNKPQFSEKYAPPWINIAVFDYTGQHIFHTYSDEFGQYNWLAPSTYAIDVPSPSGVGPKMLQFCLNYPFLQDGTEDPRHRPQYNTMCYPFNFEPGRTTYLDTPILRQAAFVGPLQQTVDCQPPTQTPMIKDVLNRPGNNPNRGEPGILRVNQNLRIRSMGRVDVPNPNFPGDSVTPGVPDDPPTEPEFVRRDYRFGPNPTTYGSSPGSPGSVCIDNYCFTGGEVRRWNQNTIVLNLDVGEFLPALDNGLQTGQLTVTNQAGNSTQVGLTVTVDDGTIGNIVRVGANQTHNTIQAGIDAAVDGDLVLVDPGIYAELPILYKRIALQGAGAGSTVIQAAHYATGPALTNPLVTWREKITAMATATPAEIGLLDEQLAVLNGDMPEFLFKDGEGPGIFVSPTAGLFAAGGARIDGFNIIHGDIGGAIYVNAYGDGLQISNNRVSANAGNLGGGIRIGNPTEPPFAVGSIAVETSPNPNINIHHNHIYQNGSKSTGGGAAIFKGADGYTVADNFICGNLSRSGGGGFTHRGLSNDAWITDNTIAFNEVFQGGQPGPGLGAVGGGGGGIEIAGDPGDPAVAGGLSEGTGDVTIRDNLIQGNLGGAADGGGIALRSINGQDVVGDINNWYRVRVQDNVIVNNVTGSGGAGISLQDAARAVIQYNTVAHNDSAAISIFTGIGTPPTTPQPAGIVSRAHSAALAAVSGDTYSIPARGAGGNNNWFRYNNFIENRSWFYTGTELLPANGATPPAPVYWDFGVVGTPDPECLNPRFSIITADQPTNDPSDCNYHFSNGIGDSSIFVTPYDNVLVTTSAADEGGNFVQVLYTPLGLTGDYTDDQINSGPRP